MGIDFPSSKGSARLRRANGVFPQFPELDSRIFSTRGDFGDFLQTNLYGDFYRFISLDFPTCTEFIRTAGKSYLVEVKNLAESIWFWFVKPLCCPPPYFFNKWVLKTLLPILATLTVSNRPI